METNLEETINVKEASKILNVSKTRVYQLIKDNRISLIDNRLSKKDVLNYKKTRKTGRPEGSYKPYDC